MAIKDFVVKNGVQAQTGHIQLATGGSNNYGYTFTGDLTTKMSSAGSGTITFLTSGTEQVRITSTGLGVGVTPSYKLDVAGQIRSSTGGFVFPDASVQTTAFTGTGSDTTRVAKAGDTMTGQLILDNVPGNQIILTSGNSSGTIQTGLRINHVTTATATSRAEGAFISSTIGDGSTTFTLPAYSAYRAANTITAAATVTDYYGVRVEAPTINGTITNLYGVRSQIASGSNRWNIYADGTADNFFGGNVGLGTASSGARLQVTNTTLSGPIITMTGNSNFAHTISSETSTGGSNGARLLLTTSSSNGEFSYANSSGELFRINSSGNVGIGFSSTISAKLDVAGSIRSASAAPQLISYETDAATDEKHYRIAQYAGKLNWELVNDANSNSYRFLEVDRTGISIDYVAFMTGANVERLRIDGSGNTYPGGNATQTLGLSTNRWSTVFATALADGADQLVGSSGATARFGYGTGWTAQSFATGGNERIRIDSSGNVGIGTSSPGAYSRLTIDGNNNSIILGKVGSGGYAELTSNSTLGLVLRSNTYYDGVSPKASVTGYSPEIDLRIDTGAITFNTSTSVSANSAIAQTETMRILNTGEVGINTTSSIRSGRLTIAADGSAANQIVLADTRAYSTTPLAQLDFAVKYNTAGTYADIAAIRGAKANATDGSQLGILQFYVNTGSSAVENMRLDSSGNLNIGNASGASAAHKVHVQGTITGAAAGRGVRVTSTVLSDVTGSYWSFDSTVATQNATFTLGTLGHFIAGNVSKGASNTLGEQIGFLASDLSSGGSNYGFYGSLSTGTNKWNLYITGTASNFLNGSTGIGTNAIATNAKLDISGTVAQNITAMAAVDMSLSSGNYFTKTVSGSTTFTISNVPATRFVSWVLKLTNGGSAAVTWPAAVKWQGGTAPTLTASGVDIISFFTDDGGTTVHGVLSSKDSK